MNFKLKRSLAQNFIIDELYLSKITSAAELQKNDFVLEIGPGLGNLTNHLVSKGAKVLAIEKDDKLYSKIKSLNETNGCCSSIKVIKADALKINFDSLIRDFTSEESKHYRNEIKDNLEDSLPTKLHRIILFANLPFNITSDFLEKVITQGHNLSELYLMVQDEVGLKMALADPGGHLYRNIAIRMRFFSSISYLFNIPQNAYYPSPNVDGCLLRLNIRGPKNYPVIRGIPSEFCEFVKLCSMSSRKMLKNNYACKCGEKTVSFALWEIGYCDKMRAFELKVDDYVNLFNLLGVGKAGQSKDLHRNIIFF
jgi:16S rRNA (adenine1518-N6/adenine1519-N6)-dimethyltransferase